MMGVFVQVNEGTWCGKIHPIGYVIQENGCWLWTGKINRRGYGWWSVDGRAQQAHRAMYEHYKGPIPQELVLDHLCRNPSCVNPDHLEPVSHRENVLRGVGVAAVNARKTHCKHGHEFTQENTYKIPRQSGGRACKKCAAAATEQWYAKNKRR